MARPLGLMVGLIVAQFPLPRCAADLTDTIHHGGEIVPANEKFPSAEAFAIKDAEIWTVGTKTEVMKCSASERRTSSIEARKSDRPRSSAR